MEKTYRHKKGGAPLALVYPDPKVTTTGDPRLSPHVEFRCKEDSTEVLPANAVEYYGPQWVSHMLTCKVIEEVVSSIADEALKEK